MPDSASCVLVISTVASTQDAERIADDLISQSLAACVQMDGPIQSFYRWAGKVERATEYRLLIKTTSAAWPKLRERLAKQHPYDEPEIVMIPIRDGSDGYLNWVIEQTS
ncbi:divalent-cation tolerance protein CutA [Novipirellula artificiosorum]|uniref:Divalent-cation tolerance protein CutA n=1 Tax=Novipirellula artificiosorum TaxID=2528016 RepID=A0A5C6DJL1_9BACT|nr:divalent-cation tolerance protein CutA [Novipirellula artificiosorum]TWU35096.1 Divalent-cation tolerance protein CutA [Novipirellula artificiosorum]